MMRLFDEFQEALAGVAYRLACGTPYVDGSLPTLLTAPANSTAAARDLFENHGRAKPQYVKWSKVTFINDTIKHVISGTDPFSLACNANANVISEMQAVRNRIAHKNTGSRAGFAKVVRSRYGAALNSMSPGLLLLTPKFSPPLLHQYVASCRLIAKDCARA
ncbi:MAG: hypothetical protein QOG34_2397 [Frankiaceae bacterium]|nr:hypothetical protein [Frankiaceae bacterium]